MFRIIHATGRDPLSELVDSSATFQPGQVAQRIVKGSQIYATVSNGTAPYGIIDDIKSSSFTRNAIDEQHIISVTSPATINNQLCLPVDTLIPLDEPHILANQFYSNVKGKLYEKNGNFLLLAGTPLNFDMTGNGTVDSIRIICSYTYQVPNMIGDDSTSGTNRVSIWIDRMIIETDMFDVPSTYPINAPLYVNGDGKFTTRKIGENPAIGMVMAPPSVFSGMLQLLWW